MRTLWARTKKMRHKPLKSKRGAALALIKAFEGPGRIPASRPGKSQLKELCKKLFSRAVRTRGCIEYNVEHGNDPLTGLPDGAIARCVTCGKLYPFKKIQCGHFVQQCRNSARFHPLNAHTQCLGCNLYGGGQPHPYRQYMVDRYGEEVIAEILAHNTEVAELSISDWIVLYRILCSWVMDLNPSDEMLEEEIERGRFSVMDALTVDPNMNMIKQILPVLKKKYATKEPNDDDSQ